MGLLPGLLASVLCPAFLTTRVGARRIDSLPVEKLSGDRLQPSTTRARLVSHTPTDFGGLVCRRLESAPARAR